MEKVEIQVKKQSAPPKGGAKQLIINITRSNNMKDEILTPFVNQEGEEEKEEEEEEEKKPSEE